MDQMRSMQYQMTTTSRLGNRSSNQDRFTVVETPNAVLMVLADGMSGHADGKLAADTVVNSVVSSFNNTQFPHVQPVQFLQQVIALAHQDILEVGARQSPPTEPRTTCVVALVQQGSAWSAHVGDSRLYWIRNGHTILRTKDHSRVEELYQNGLIDADQREKHPQRNIVTQCMGSISRKPKPRVSEAMHLQRDDVLLLCSDGLWGAVPQAQIPEFLEKFEIDYALEHLAHNAEENSYPKCDNISAIAFRWQNNVIQQVYSDPPPQDDLAELTQSLDALNHAMKKFDRRS